MQNDRLTLLIHSCDRYSDLWEAHAELLNKNWAERSVRTLLVSDLPGKVQLEGVEVHFAGAGRELSERMAYALSLIDTPYILITLEDYFPIYRIDPDGIERLLDIMDAEQLDYIRLFPDPNSHKSYRRYRHLFEISLKTNYQVNLRQGIWRKSFVEKTIGERKNAWEYEVSLTPIAIREKAKCVLSKGGEFRTLDVVRKGRILHRADRYLRKHHLYHGSRPVISYREELRIEIFSLGKKLLPRWMAVKVKEFLRKRGYSFYSRSI